MIFACFMTASMVGSAAAGLLMSKTQIRIESYMQTVFGVAAASLFVPFWCHLNPGEAQLAARTWLVGLPGCHQDASSFDPATADAPNTTSSGPIHPLLLYQLGATCC